MVGETIVFIGTPCKVYALTYFLNSKKIDMANLFIVNIISHEVPNVMLCKDFREWLEEKYHLRLINFPFRLNNPIGKSTPSWQSLKME